MRRPGLFSRIGRWRGTLLAAILLAAAPVGEYAARAEPTVLRDIAYGPDPLQTMDVYLPPDIDDPPVIFMLHGGAWLVGDKAVENVYVNKTRHWLDKGYVFVSVNTRLVPEADPVEQAGDLAAALAAAQSMAGSWGGDPGRFVLVGHSSGGHLAALLTADAEIAARNGVRPWRATIVLDGGYDVPRIMTAPHMAFYDKVFGDDPDFWRRASPIHRLAGPPVPMLLVCSSLSAKACALADDFAQKVDSLGGSATVLPQPLSHTAINADLGLPGPYTDAVDGFLAAHGLP